MSDNVERSGKFFPSYPSPCKSLNIRMRIGLSHLSIFEIIDTGSTNQNLCKINSIGTVMALKSLKLMFMILLVFRTQSKMIWNRITWGLFSSLIVISMFFCLCSRITTVCQLISKRYWEIIIRGEKDSDNKIIKVKM